MTLSHVGLELVKQKIIFTRYRGMCCCLDLLLLLLADIFFFFFNFQIPNSRHTQHGQTHQNPSLGEEVHDL